MLSLDFLMQGLYNLMLSLYNLMLGIDFLMLSKRDYSAMQITTRFSSFVLKG